MLSAKSWPEKEKARKLRNSATASWRKTKRQWKSDWIKRVTVEMEVAMQRHDLGTFYRGLKELGDEVTSSMLKLATSTKEGLIALTESMCVVTYGSS